MTDVKPKVLIIDDDTDVLDAYQHLLEMADISCICQSDPIAALSQLEKDWPGIVVSDICMPKMDGMEVLHQVKLIDVDIPILMISGHGDIPMAVEAVKQGALDFIEKPVDPPRFLKLISAAQEQRRAQLAQRKILVDNIQAELLGDSPGIRQVRSELAKLAPTELSILIQGPPGSGKGVCAQIIHQASNKSSGPKHTVNCEGLNDSATLLAAARQASNGSLILQNLHLLNSELQAQLANLLLEGKLAQQYKLRLICLAQEPLQSIVSDGDFRPELYYHLAQAKFNLPALTDRTGDIPLLFRHFLESCCKRLEKNLPEVSADYLKQLSLHRWPGNLLELKNVAELYAIGIHKLPGRDEPAITIEDELPLDTKIGQFERKVIEETLMICHGRVNDAADKLRIPRKKLYLRMKKYQLDKTNYK